MPRINPQKNTSGGYSVFELLVYAAIFAVVFGIVVEVVVVTAQSLGKARVERAVLTAGSTALERMLREFRFADEIDIGGSVLGANPGAIKLNTIVSPADETPTTREFFISGKDILMQEASTATSTLTSGVTVSRLVFYALTASSSQAVRVEMTLEAGTGTHAVSRNFSTTGVLRRRY